MNGVDSMPGIEPLSRAAWQRIEARVFESLDRRDRSGAFPAVRPPVRRRPHRGWVGALAMVASASLLWLALGRAPGAGQPNAPVTPGTAATAAQRDAESTRAAHDGSRVATTSGPAEVAVGDSVLTIAAQSVVQVHGDDHSGWLIQLHRGEVGCRVAPRGNRPPFVVRAGDTTVTVVGTRFTVARSGEQARVSVQEGTVRVERQGKEVILHAGDSWPSAADEASPVPDAALPLPAPVDPASLAAPGTDERDLDEPNADDERSLTPAGHGQTHALPSSQGLFEHAARLEAREPKAALELYRRVGARGPWAANALYGRARLELELGNTARARRDLELYLRRYPRGANASDVRALLERRPDAERP